MKPQITCSTSVREDWCLPVILPSEHEGIWGCLFWNIVVKDAEPPAFVPSHHHSCLLLIQHVAKAVVPPGAERVILCKQSMPLPMQSHTAPSAALPLPLCAALYQHLPQDHGCIWGGTMDRSAAVQRSEVFLHCITAVSTLGIFTLSFPPLKINK